MVVGRQADATTIVVIFNIGKFSVKDIRPQSHPASLTTRQAFNHQAGLRSIVDKQCAPALAVTSIFAWNQPLGLGTGWTAFSNTPGFWVEFFRHVCSGQETI